MGRLLSQLDPKPPDCKSSRLGFGVLGGKPAGCLDKRPLWTFLPEKVIKEIKDMVFFLCGGRVLLMSRVVDGGDRVSAGRGVA